MEFARERDDIVGHRQHGGSSGLPEAYGEKIIGLGR
jgi:hypothetical protein